MGLKSRAASVLQELVLPFHYCFCIFLVFSFLRLHHANASSPPEVFVKLLRTPNAITNRNSATFTFQALHGSVNNSQVCSDCSFFECKLDDHIAISCESGKIFYSRLQDGNHTFEVCTNRTQGGELGCASYNWIVDTVPPTASVTASSYFTSASSISVNISFNEPCTGGGGFGCSTVDACNLLVYGAGQVIPDTFEVVQPNFKFSLMVGLSTSLQYGRVIIVMDKNFCTDSAGNKFVRTENSSVTIHFDRRAVLVDVRTRIPEKMLQLNSTTRTVLATNRNKNLKVFFYFTEPVVNSSTEILDLLSTSQGSLQPIGGDTIGNRRFGFQVTDISPVSVVTVSINSSLIVSRQGTNVSPVPPVTFLYDSERPGVRLSTTSSTRTREKSISILIKFIKPVFGFNSSHVSVTGGHSHSFRELSRSVYTVAVQADGENIMVSIPENVTSDIAGNQNLASNTLQVKHYSAPMVPMRLSTLITVAFIATAVVAGLLSLSTASLQTIGAFPNPTLYLTSDPARSLFRMASHIQVFALSRWLAVKMPVEYYEFTRGLQWSIPYLRLPWEKGHAQSVVVGSNSSIIGSKIYGSGIFVPVKSKANNMNLDAIYGLPLTPMEYRSFFESQSILPEAQYVWDSQNSNRWRDFYRSMFWLGIIGGSLILLHCLLLLVLRLRRYNKEKNGRQYGALVFPRFEIFLLILALPCVCEASAALIKGGATSGIIVGILLLGAVAFLLLGLFLFLSIGITLGKLLQYKEVHQERQKFHWYHELIRVTLGPGKKGQWTWKNQPNSLYLTMLGPLFEDLRGPPKYMLSQISGGTLRKRSDSIIASDDETEDAEAPFIQKLFGILRIYYTLLDSAKRVAIGIVAGAYSSNWSSRGPIIALLSIASFQLFFMVLKKPFIKKKVQLVQIISISCEVGIFASCMVLLDREFTTEEETKICFFMISLVLLAFLSLLINEWYALYRQIKQMEPEGKSFWLGLKTTSIGLLLFILPRNCFKNLDNTVKDQTTTGNTPSSSADRNHMGSGSRTSGERPWLRQLRALAKASFSKEGSPGIASDPSTSRVRWSGFWNMKSSGSSSVKSSTDFKSKPLLWDQQNAIFVLCPHSSYINICILFVAEDNRTWIFG
ncbi:hypothetical protein LIER_17992 [Lithospermum erythrorhizon]|uniref:Bacterial Ig-like domain-containing protein n=1 Tax=Lithospermum erythrorhizon TaxID=34254 RepID=A0AAV3QGT6_LITER